MDLFVDWHVDPFEEEEMFERMVEDSLPAAVALWVVRLIEAGNLGRAREVLTEWRWVGPTLAEALHHFYPPVYEPGCPG